MAGALLELYGLFLVARDIREDERAPQQQTPEEVRHKDGLDRRAFEQMRDELGQQGFELFWILPEQKLYGEKDGNVFIFESPALAEPVLGGWY